MPQPGAGLLPALERNLSDATGSELSFGETQPQPVTPSASQVQNQHAAGPVAGMPPDDDESVLSEASQEEMGHDETAQSETVQSVLSETVQSVLSETVQDGTAPEVMEVAEEPVATVPDDVLRTPTEAILDAVPVPEEDLMDYELMQDAPHGQNGQPGQGVQGGLPPSVPPPAFSVPPASSMLVPPVPLTTAAAAAAHPLPQASTPMHPSHLNRPTPAEGTAAAGPTAAGPAAAGPAAAGPAAAGPAAAGPAAWPLSQPQASPLAPPRGGAEVPLLRRPSPDARTSPFGPSRSGGGGASPGNGPGRCTDSAVPPPPRVGATPAVTPEGFRPKPRALASCTSAPSAPKPVPRPPGYRMCPPSTHHRSSHSGSRPAAAQGGGRGAQAARAMGEAWGPGYSDEEIADLVRRGGRDPYMRDETRDAAAPVGRPPKASNKKPARWNFLARTWDLDRRGQK